MFSQSKVSTTFIAILVIGALIVILNTTGYLNNASNLSSIILFTAFAVAFALFYDLDNKQPMIVKAPTYEEKIIG